MVVVFVGAFLFVWRERERIGLSFQFWTTLLDPKTHRKKSSKIIQFITRYVVVTFSLGQSPQNRRTQDGRDEESLEKTRGGPVRTTRRVVVAAALRFVCDFDVLRQWGSFKGDDVLFGDLRWCDTLRAALFFFVLCLRRVRIVSSADPN